MLTRITRENLPTNFNPMWRTSECSYEDLPFTKSHHSRIQLKDMCALVPPPFSVLPIFFHCQTKWGGVLWSRYEPWWVRPQTVWHDREWRWRGVWGGGVVLSFLYGIWWHLVPVQQLFSCVCVCVEPFFFFLTCTLEISTCWGSPWEVYLWADLTPGLTFGWSSVIVSLKEWVCVSLAAAASLTWPLGERRVPTPELVSFTPPVPNYFKLFLFFFLL